MRSNGSTASSPWSGGGARTQCFEAVKETPEIDFGRRDCTRRLQSATAKVPNRPSCQGTGPGQEIRWFNHSLARWTDGAAEPWKNRPAARSCGGTPQGRTGQRVTWYPWHPTGPHFGRKLRAVYLGGLQQPPFRSHHGQGSQSPQFSRYRVRAGNSLVLFFSHSFARWTDSCSCSRVRSPDRTRVRKKTKYESSVSNMQ